MSTPREPNPAKLFVSVISALPELLATALSWLADRYGGLDFVSPVLPFNYTDYYCAEMGQPLIRRFASFVDLISPDELVLIKLETNRQERRLSEGGQRKVNIDPGYLLPERLVLASGKDSAHRLYLGQGIYGDLTLMFQSRDYRPLPWTYPDYAETRVRGWLRALRQKYLVQLRLDDKSRRRQKP